MHYFRLIEQAVQRKHNRTAKAPTQSVSGLVPLYCTVALGALSLGLLVTGSLVTVRRAAIASGGAFLVITAVFIAAGQMAHARVRQAAFLDFPAEQLIDVVLSPMPADPLCWDALVLSVDKDRYLARRERSDGREDARCSNDRRRPSRAVSQGLSPSGRPTRGRNL